MGILHMTKRRNHQNREKSRGETINPGQASRSAQSRREKHMDAAEIRHERTGACERGHHFGLGAGRKGQLSC